MTPLSILLLYNTPYPIAGRLISWISGEGGPEHCALDFGYAVYDAFPPACRRLTPAEWSAWLAEGVKMRPWWRRWTGKQLRVERWVPPGYLWPETTTMRGTAESLVGKPYGSMILDYLFGRDLDCSGFVACCLASVGLGNWPRGEERTAPREILNFCKASEWTCTEVQL